MIAITTKYHGATNTRGARISATANGHRVYISYPYEFSGAEAHFQAAKQLCIKMNWLNSGNLISGGTETGYVFCFSNSESFKL